MKRVSVPAYDGEVSERGQIQMTVEEVDAFLLEPHTLQVASINPDGAPHLVAMYYAMIDGRISFWTYGRSQKVLNLQRDPRLTVMAEAGRAYSELRGVSVTGKAEISADPEVVASVGEALFPRYFGELDDRAREGVRHTARKRVAVFVEPSRVVSWDHSKLGG